MKKTNKNRKYSGYFKVFSLLGSLLVGANAAVAAVPALFMEQSSAITGASDTLAASRVPVRNSSGVISYYDIVFKLQLDATGKPVLAPLYPTVNTSSSLISAGFKAGKYKDSFANIYQVSGPTVAGAGRTSWSILMTKPGTSCSTCTFQGSWTTGPIAGHPLQTKLTAQNITIPAYSWGTVATGASNQSGLFNCSNGNFIVGFAQIGNQMNLHGYCANTNVENVIFTLNLCTTANPCP